jgi:colanic acid/amylovoran biosynthesis glycosyltransferase
MKVTFCTREYDNLSGGQNTWLCRFVPDLRQRGIEARVLCFTLSREGELPTVRLLRQAGIDCTTSSDEEKKYTEQRVRWVLERLAEDPPDAFVANMVIPAAYYAGRWLREAGIPTIGICHVGADHFLYSGLLEQFVLGKAAYQVSAFVCVSKYLEQDILERNPKGILVRRIPCGVPVSEAVAKKPNGRLRLAYVGRLSEEAKRISEVTRAFCRAVREVPGTEAFIYGDGEDHSAVQHILREEGEGLPVHLAGPVENDQIRKNLLRSHAVVLLSDWEGFGLALLEGMACGVVPIGLRRTHSGALELIEDGVTGLLVDDRGDGFVAAVRRLREDPALWERLARSARAHVKTEYSEEICTDRWQELLRELVNGCASRKPLRIPRRLRLPSVHPALAVIDDRVVRPHQRLIRRVRCFVERAVRYFCRGPFLRVRPFISRLL